MALLNLDFNRSWSDYKKHWTLPLLFVFLTFPGVITTPIAIVMCYYIPCLYYKNNKVLSFYEISHFIIKNFRRIFIAGILHMLATSIGFLLCGIPGIIVSLSTPIVISKIVNSDKVAMDCVKEGISDFWNGLVSGSTRTFALVQIILLTLMTIASTITCGIGTFFAIPYTSFCLYNFLKNNYTDKSVPLLESD